MPLLGNFSDTCCIHCCYKNIVPPHLIMLYLLIFILLLFLPPTPVFFPYFLRAEIWIHVHVVTFWSLNCLFFCDYFIFWCFLKFHSGIFLQFLSLKLLKRLSFFWFCMILVINYFKTKIFTQKKFLVGN